MLDGLTVWLSVECVTDALIGIRNQDVSKDIINNLRSRALNDSLISSK